jgi:hypothetical protein
MGRVRLVGRRPTIVKHYINCTSGIAAHEDFWSAIFRHTRDVTVITTNYDILAERGLRVEPRPRVFRPGFNYGNGAEILAGGGFPSYSHLRPLILGGTVPLLKLHGSISWSIENSALVRFHDCRPAIKGNAAIVAPVTNKNLPKYLQHTWKQAANALSVSHTWLVIGYSLPSYDRGVRSLLQGNSKHRPNVLVFDPNPLVVSRYTDILDPSTVHGHDGLPNAIATIEQIVHGGAGA